MGSAKTVRSSLDSAITHLPQTSRGNAVLKRVIGKQLRRGLVPLGLAGAISGVGSYLQHKQGVHIGKKLTPKKRREVAAGK
jgi:hypothetical protein